MLSRYKEDWEGWTASNRKLYQNSATQSEYKSTVAINVDRNIGTFSDKQKPPNILRQSDTAVEQHTAIALVAINDIQCQ